MHLRPGWQSAAAAAGLMLVGTALAFLSRAGRRSMTKRVALLLVSIPLLVLGGESLYRAAISRQQVTSTCERFARERPRGVWLRLTSCEIDYVHAGYRESNGQITELLFPVRPAGQPDTLPAPVVVSTRDPVALAVAQETIGGNRQPDQEQFLVMMLRIVTILKAARDVDGHARARLLDRVRRAQVVSGLTTPIDPAFVVIDLHARPSLLLPALEAAAGVQALLAFLVLSLPRRSVRQRVMGREAGAAAAVRLHRLMLLNLDANAGPDAIETAPALGSRADVAHKLADALPGLHVNDSRRAVLHERDCAIEIDLGAHDPIATAVISASGERAAAAVQRLLVATGWRAFAPRAGTFVSPAQLETPAARAG